MPPTRLRPQRLAPDRGVSTVIGVVLMVAIVVILAAVVAGMALGFEDRLRDPAPLGDFDYEYDAAGEGNTNDRPYVNITHDLGRTVDADDIVIRDEAGNKIRWSNVWTGGPEVKAGEHVHIDGFASDSVLDPICAAGHTYYVIYRNEGGTDVVTEWSAPQDPSLPSTSPYNRGDGIPTWC